ncbi:type II toxin-antitoxin system PemK/MazF family toxin [Candidatus Woesearchaeota archaeon]|nr:type II toxin-antitoxin system PemK/MazF family toxin [Candidatus Woesearchaeota archaeon]
MVGVKRGEIWLVNLDPTVGHEIKKTRPALVIQNDIGNAHSSLTIVAPLTSQHVDKTYPTEAFLSAIDSKLGKDSKILLNQLRSVDKRRLLRKIGTISARIQENVDEALKVSLGLVKIDEG